MKVRATYLKYRESIKLGFIIGGFVSNLVILGLVAQVNQQAADNTARVRELTEQVREGIRTDNLAREDARRSSEERLARAVSYVDCLARLVIEMQDRQVELVDLDGCHYLTVPVSSLTSPGAASEPTDVDAVPTPKPGTERTETPSNNGTGGGNDDEDEPEPRPSLVDRLIDGLQRLL